MGETSASGRFTDHQEFRRIQNLSDTRQYEEALARARFLVEQKQTGLFIRARTHDFLCWLLYEALTRPCAEAVLHGEEAVRLFRSQGDQQREARALVHLGQARLLLCEFANATTGLRTARDLLDVVPEAIPGGPVLARILLGEALVQLGQEADGISVWQEAEQLSALPEFKFLGQDLWRRWGLHLLRAERVNEATAMLERLDETLNRRNMSHWWKTSCRIARARLLVARREFEAARKTLQFTLALARELGDLPTTAECHCLLGVIDIEEGTGGAALRARSALTFAIAAGRRDLVEEVHRRLGDLL